ncbi:uncharacterized protein EKO05_0002929 [Ascochyta rabiei]|uniref:Uncharacterized protein n=1 Tax=Didymella rabiei TaxID=5454 RepID=A0A162X6W1_DIDRA|nr:uncharacterized protein EKO05_0002929 [Ascochyta rabiei]KZM19378.1 hypothetical protein ST47_g9525 [Ascochyta rabiei]UPX12379.1 hypothetical protein EKO05_0002929 [Ascochyta rabiei]
MRISTLAFAGLAAAAPSSLVARKDGRPDYSGTYWDVTISTQSGRPGYSIRDLTTTFHRAGAEQTVPGSCHYSFVPQGTSAPAVTDRCDKGLTYTWNYTTLTMRQDVVVGNETIWFFATPTKIETTRKSDGTGGSSYTGTGRVELHHYCNDHGCSDVDGCVTIECQEGKTN